MARTEVSKLELGGEDAAWTAQFNARRLARQWGLSLRQLERRFHKQFGISPKKWLQERRMEAARRLLLDGQRAQEVAMALHFKQLSHFCRVLKKTYGLASSQLAESEAARASRAPQESNGR
ncbi:MAG: helix-turn-helix transcriptional regulator [Verrucomicrobia bacterium]|nr:helix-turn-helix transcriptional regulator [Verrucomicrobiota bacterium]